MYVGQPGDFTISSGYNFTLGLGPANERRRYIVTSFLISWAHIQYNPVFDACDNPQNECWFTINEDFVSAATGTL